MDKMNTTCLSGMMQRMQRPWCVRFTLVVLLLDQDLQDQQDQISRIQRPVTSSMRRRCLLVNSFSDTDRKQTLIGNSFPLAN